MFILKSKRKLKNTIVVTMLFTASLAVDMTLPAPTHNLQEARFLGIGKKVTKMPCILGVRNVITKVTVFGITISKTTKAESCV